MRPINPIQITNCLLENPLAKIAVSSFLLLSLLIENNEATKHETGKILMRNVGNSRRRSIMMALRSFVPFKRPVKICPRESTIIKMNTAPKKNVSHSLRMSFLIVNIWPYKKDKS